MSRTIRTIGLIFLPVLACGQNVSQEVLQLAQKALEKNYVLQNQRAEIEKSRLDVKSVWQRYIPRVEAYGAYAYFSNNLMVDNFTVGFAGFPILGRQLFSGRRTFDINGQFLNAGLLAKTVLFSGLQIPYGAKAAEQKTKAQNFLAQKEAAELLSELLAMIDQVALLKQYKTILDQSRKRLQKEAERVDRAIKVGLATPYEVQKIELAQLTIESKRLEHDSKRTLLYEKLSMLTGVEKQLLQQIEIGLQAWRLPDQEGAIGNRPEIKALEASIEAIEFKLKMNKYAFLPKILLFGGYSYMGLYGLNTHIISASSGKGIDLKLDRVQSYPTWLIGLGMKWELFDGFHRKHELEKVRWDKTIAMNKKKQAEERLLLLSKKLKSDLELSQKQIRLKTKQEQLAQYALEIAAKSYYEGLISVSEMLEAEADFQNVRLERLQAICDQRKAAVELLKSYGLLDLEHLNRS